MAPILLIEPVVKICAIISGIDEARDWAKTRIASRWGTIAECSVEIPFEAGGYYTQQMGSKLTKTLIAVEAFADPAGLADWKHETNRWEHEYAQGSNSNVTRPLNLDAGYLSQAKLLLGTTKDRDHRIYLRDGMFAEITLNYVGKRWIHHRWSYPSYRTEEVADFAVACRKRLRTHLIATGQLRRRDGAASHPDVTDSGAAEANGNGPDPIESHPIAGDNR